jgi:hypothetical protein
MGYFHYTWQCFSKSDSKAPTNAPTKAPNKAPTNTPTPGSSCVDFSGTYDDTPHWSGGFMTQSGCTASWRKDSWLGWEGGKSASISGSSFTWINGPATGTSGTLNGDVINWNDGNSWERRPATRHPPHPQHDDSPPEDLSTLRFAKFGSSETSGRLEIFKYGSWGTICDDGFDDNAADVACRQMGFEGGSFEGNQYGAGTGNIKMAYVDCTGSESSLFDCDFSVSFGWGEGDGGGHNCGHVEDVSVSCYGTLFNPKTQCTATMSPTSVPTAIPTHMPTKAGYEVVEQNIQVSALLTEIPFPLTNDQARSCLVQAVLAGSVATSLGLKDSEVTVSKVGGEASTCNVSRRLASSRAGSPVDHTGGSNSGSGDESCESCCCSKPLTSSCDNACNMCDAYAIQDGSYCSEAPTKAPTKAPSDSSGSSDNGSNGSNGSGSSSGGGIGIEFEIILPSAKAVTWVTNSIKTVATSGVLVANVQKKAAESGVRVAALNNMPRELAAPVVVVAKKTIKRKVQVRIPTPSPTPSPTEFCEEVDCMRICEYQACSTFLRFKAQCEFTGRCNSAEKTEVESLEVGLEAAEIAGIACCAVSIFVLLATYYKRRQHAGKSTSTPLPDNGPPVVNVVLTSTKIQAPSVAPITQALSVAPITQAPSVAPMIQAPLESAARLADPIVLMLKLKGLLDAGALTQEEFDAKKAEQLARI